MEKGIKKKVFKTAIIEKMMEGKEESYVVDPAILESAIAKHGRILRAETGEVNWALVDISTVIEYYDNYGKKPEKPETAKDSAPIESAVKKPIAKKKTESKKAAVPKPLKKAAKKAAPKKAAKKAAPKKKVSKK